MTSSISNPPVIVLNDVIKVYKEGPVETVALRGINLSVSRGDYLAICGPSGCGKSTLLRLIADLDKPSAGALQVNGHAPEVARKSREYGFVFQAPTLYEWRTVARNTELPLEVMGRERKEWKPRVDKMLAMVGLRDFHDHFPWQLSGGMQQRASIARALSFDPAILLMDEPFGALDEQTRLILQSELLRIWETTGKTVVFVTHSIDEAMILADRIIVLSARPGQIKADITVPFARPRTVEAVRSAPEFASLFLRIWSLLRDEVTTPDRAVAS